MRIHVISGTHWDREWRYSVEQSKPRLAALIDHLLRVLDDVPEYRCFHVDGGAIVLEDYASVRPEMDDKLRRYIGEGRISLVNWYTLPDEFIVAPEALVRNLLVGRRVAARYGGSMKTGYTATSYGQISQLPQIYQGFGIETALFYRGTNKHQVPALFRWEGPDGSAIHVIRCFDEVTRTNWFFYVHQPLVLGKPARDTSYTYDPANWPVHMADADGYEGDFHILREDPTFCDDEASIRAAFEGLKAQAYPQAIGRHVLALDMEDNAQAYALLPKLLTRMNEVIGEADFTHDRLDDYVATVLAEVAKRDIPTLRGELRYTAIEPGWNGLLGMTQSSRVKLKLLNEQAETQLIHVAEPLAAAAACFGHAYPRSILDIAWINLLQCHAHDSICGAAIDPAHDDMPTRFRAATSIAHEVTRKACQSIWAQLDLSNFRGEFRGCDVTLTVFNTAMFGRRQVLPLVVDLPQQRGGDVPDYKYFDVIDADGKPVDHAILSRESIQMRAERELDTSVRFPVERVRLLVDAKTPSLGYATYAIRPHAPRYEADPKPAGDRGLIGSPNGVLENEHLCVQVHSNGTFDLTRKGTDRSFRGLHLFVDSGSIGDAHGDRAPLRDTQITSLGVAAGITLVENNPLLATFRIDLTLPIPAAATADGKDRLREMVDLPISTWLTLTKGDRRLAIRTRLDNRARDHRLRVLFPSGIKTDSVSVESAFAVEKRNFLWKRTGDNAEGHYPYQPMRGFLDVSDGKFGLAILNKGLREYEVIDDHERTIALTLFRGHRGYMLANRTMTPDELDKYTGLQCFGEHEFHYAIYPHDGDWVAGDVLTQAWDFKLPLRCIQGVPHTGKLPAAGSFVSVDDERVMLSAFCQSEDGQALTLRLWNRDTKAVKTTLRTTLPIQTITKMRLDETQEIERLAAGRDGAWALHLRPSEIVTLRLKSVVTSNA